MTDDPDVPDFKPIDQPWQLEYNRLRKLGGGDYWKGCRLAEQEARSKMSPYELGRSPITERRDRNAQSPSADPVSFR
jgi:hypothetical protein